MLEPLMFAGYMSGGQLMLTSDIENFPGYPKHRWPRDDDAIARAKPQGLV